MNRKTTPIEVVCLMDAVCIDELNVMPNKGEDPALEERLTRIFDFAIAALWCSPDYYDAELAS